ncbi:hypothetical protein SGFS_087350 [Streptomyces graminofaciens]|uniref:Nucleotidyltransferase n=1 Tax=Streptomyces graminofaciens TaxID=68212 RepID=A0ABM7FK03_9ACTN|nr:nucleotidyltransferase [Streptomyces graminofaciens]BBC37441.1 hypothetical protein SGFS_087350 [Streptomyces graminofaciens]
MTHSDATVALLDRFLDELHDLAPVAVWAHGSLGGGDYQQGRSDLDLIAVLRGPITPSTVWRVASLHARLRADPLADKLHCTYLTPGTAADVERRHLTRARKQLFKRPVGPVARRELHTFGLVLHGEAVKELLPPVSDGDLAESVVQEQWEWRLELAEAARWHNDLWVDLGLLTHARALVTLSEGRLITKREALDLLPTLGAPVEVVEDIERRRYEGPGDRPPSEEWTARRSALTREYLGPAIDALVRTYG